MERFEFVQMKMGVPVRIILYCNSPELAQNAADKAFERFDQLNAIMSDYDKESEIVQLAIRNDKRFFETKGSDTDLFPISDDLFQVLKAARHYSKISDGAFEVSVSPLVQVWRRAQRLRKLPKESEIALAREKVGLAFWELQESDDGVKSVRFLRDGMRFDFGGIGKGYAVDQAFDLIQNMGILIVLVDAGGDMRIGDAPPGGGWKIEISAQTQDITKFSNIAIAASGDTFQYFELEGQRFSHIIDPHSGYPLVNQALVTVFAKTAMEADALASALSVLSPEKRELFLAKLPDIKAIIVSKNGSEVESP